MSNEDKTDQTRAAGAASELKRMLYGKGIDMTVDDLVAKYEKDPEMKASLEKARADLARLKERLGDAAFREWLLSHFVNVEDIRCDV